MFSAISTVGLIAVAGVAAGVAILGTSLRLRRRDRQRRPALPVGADAALWSVTEVLPDPRNHLAIKDPTSEFRLSATDWQTAAARWHAEQVPTAPLAVPADRQVAALPVSNVAERQIDLRLWPEGRPTGLPATSAALEMRRLFDTGDIPAVYRSSASDVAHTAASTASTPAATLATGASTPLPKRRPGHDLTRRAAS